MMTNKILAKKLVIITESGRKIEYTHVTLIDAEGKILIVHGETNDSYGMRCNVRDNHNIEGLLVTWIEWHVPK